MLVQYLGTTPQGWYTSLQEQRSLSKQFHAATEDPAGEQATWQVGTTWPGRVMPCALWPGSVAGSIRGKNMLLLYFSEFGLVNGTIKKHSLTSKQNVFRKAEWWKKRKGGMVCALPYAQRRKGTVFSLACSIQHVCRRKKPYTRLRWRLSAAETVHLHRSCSLS